MASYFYTANVILLQLHGCVVSHMQVLATPLLSVHSIKGAVSLFMCLFFCFCSVCVCRLHFKFQRLDAALLQNITLRIHLLAFISCFVIDLLSI